MKKRFLILLSLVLLFVAVMIPVQASDVESVSANSHQYVQEVASPEFLKTPATCMKKAVYYKSCGCGCNTASPDGETFEHGELLAHKFDREAPGEAYLVSPATCTKKAVDRKSCVGSTPGTETFEYGNLLNHVFDREVATDKYKDESVVVTCSQKQVYFKSCVCGEKSNEQKFESGKTLDHTWAKKRANQVCVDCGAVNEGSPSYELRDSIIAACAILAIFIAAFLIVFLPKVIKIKRKW